VTDDPRADLVAQQYRRWRYPEPIENLEAWLAGNWERFDPSHAHRLMWPDRPYPADMDILSAGCGTNQAPVIAYTNPSARVTGVDISEESLAHSRYLKDKYRLTNLELHLLPIEEVGALGQSFDLIMCTGVLHHMASPEVGIRALADVLRSDGVIALMVYARYGRLGVEILQSAFRDMGLNQDLSSVQVVRAALDALPSTHPLVGYASAAPDLQFDTGLVDTFLHGRDRSYTVGDCLDLLRSAGLAFQDWLLKSNYHPLPLTAPDNSFVAAVAELPAEKMWSVVERINTTNACHFFLATSPDRATDDYRIDFLSDDAVNYVPLYRFQCGLDGQGVFRPDWSTPLTSLHHAFASHVDGELSVAQIAQRVGATHAAGGASATELVIVGLELFESLWRADFVAIDTSRIS